MAAEIRKRCARWRVEPRWFVIDPSAQNRLHQTGRSDQMEYADAGIYTVPGTELRHGRHQPGEDLPPDRPAGDRANCPILIDEFRRYRWATPKQKGDDDPAEKPIKKDDHILDAFRYVVMARPILPDREVAEAADPLYVRLAKDAMQWEKPRVNAGISQGGPGRFL
jgi:hypothetical protein